MIVDQYKESINTLNYGMSCICLHNKVFLQLIWIDKISTHYMFHYSSIRSYFLQLETMKFLVLERTADQKIKILINFKLSRIFSQSLHNENWKQNNAYHLPHILK